MKVETYRDHQGRFVGIRFKCPGCKEDHTLPISRVPCGETKSPYYVLGQTPHWHFSGDYDHPTLSPSVNDQSGHYAGGSGEDGCWCTYYELHPPAPGEEIYKCHICHFLLRDGEIEFLPDCTHELSGQKVILPEIEVLQDKAA